MRTVTVRNFHFYHCFVSVLRMVATTLGWAVLFNVTVMPKSKDRVIVMSLEQSSHNDGRNPISIKSPVIYQIGTDGKGPFH